VLLLPPRAQYNLRMRLADFILTNIEPILQEWEDFARSLSPGDKMQVLELRDDAEAILRACVRDMRTMQSGPEQTSKSRGHGGAGGTESDGLDDASAVHGVGRVGSGFNLNEVVSEYRALRASVLKLWRQNVPALDLNDVDDITRFHESIDQSLAKAVASYAHRVDRSRRMFLAILGHDLRNPLNCISMSAQLASLETKDTASSEMLSQIETSVQAISRLVQDLLDFAATGLGGRMPLVMAPVNIEALGREVLAEIKVAHPGRTLRFEAKGDDLTCHCDGARMRQALSNLLGNALQHGSKGGAVELSMSSEAAEFTLSVRNQGLPIPPNILPTIFDPLVRGTTMDAMQNRRAGNIGLGLYIAREIVTSHGGVVEVASSAEAGTVFTIRMPRRQAEH
jgi:signal transduction histidine kinase